MPGGDRVCECGVWGGLQTAPRHPVGVGVVVSSLSRGQLFDIPWTVGHQAPTSMRFPRQEYWSGLPFPTPGDLPNPGIETASPVSPTLAGGFFTTKSPGNPIFLTMLRFYSAWPFPVTGNMLTVSATGGPHMLQTDQDNSLSA